MFSSRFVGKVLFLGIALMVVKSTPVLAIPTITCHCFTERSYDPGKPAAADAYFLTTAQNTFLATAFNADKKSVVLKKQQGVLADDLWIAYWVASRSANDPDRLLEARTQNSSWQKLLTPMLDSPEQLGVRFSKAVALKAPDDQLATVVVDELLTGYQLVDDGQLDALRKDGASNQELILASILAKLTGQPVRQIFLQLKSGDKSWGAMLHEAGVDGKSMQQAVTKTLRLHSQPVYQER